MKIYSDRLTVDLFPGDIEHAILNDGDLSNDELINLTDNFKFYRLYLIPDGEVSGKLKLRVEFINKKYEAK